ncbi:MAG TPA: dihydrolipoamide acetyltransferase family protein [Vicinamibacterales bacterium]|nr:dihydrolipoamide acetyltransferase family protein [Vicinamibacterales bacterium]
MDVVMPQMGESVAEGTIVRWIKKVGDKVDRDEPLFEISTDKVDAEIPSPGAGILSEIRAQEGETVPVNSIVAVIGGASDVVTPPPKKQAPPVSAPPPQTISATPPESSVTASTATEQITRERTSPLVRQLAKEHNVDIAQVRGTGIGGRVTKDDVLAFIAGGHNGQAKEAAVATHLPDDRVEKMSVMRKKIAEHMVASRRTSAHVHTVFEVDFSRVASIRERKKTSYLSFIIKAVVDALKAFPILNVSVDGDNVVYHKQINIGVAVALETGLIVPVIKQADHLDLAGIGHCVADLAARARSKHLSPDDVVGGTFTVTNPGAFGALSGTPIINQPQVAILGIGSIEKRPVVVNDAVVPRITAILTLGFDHRIIDGAVADQFMAQVKRALENWDENRA